MEHKKRTVVSAEPFVRKHRNFFVGIFILIPLLTIPVLLVYTVLKSDGFRKWYTLYVFYDNSQGLKKGNQVTISGTSVGHVKEVELVRERVVCVSFQIREPYYELINKKTRAELKQKGFVGDWEIELKGDSLAKEGTPGIKNGDTLIAVNAASLSKTIENATATLKKVDGLINDIKEGRGTVGQLFTDDSLYTYAKQIGANTAGLTENAKQLTYAVRGTVRKTDSLLMTLKNVGDGGKTMIDTLMTVIATLRVSLEETQAIVANLKTVSDDAPELMDRLQDNIGEAELMMRSLQKNWLLRQTMGKQPDPLLDQTP